MKHSFFNVRENIHHWENSQENKSEMRVWMHEFSHPNERQDILKKLEVSSQFDMRYRGLVNYYGDDLIAYKLKKGSGKHANEFLRIFSKYLTDYLEDDCPTSWKECQPSFWEELIYAYFPLHLKTSNKRRETDAFLLQLKRFVRWLDQRVGTSSYNLVEKYSEEALPDLKKCEHLLNQLFLKSYPNIHTPNWNIEEDLALNETNLNKCTEKHHSLFQVYKILNDIITVNDLHTSRTYQIYGIPINKVQHGMLIQGVIGKKRDDMFWTWYITGGVYPSRAKDFIKPNTNSH